MSYLAVGHFIVGRNIDNRANTYRLVSAEELRSFLVSTYDLPTHAPCTTTGKNKVQDTFRNPCFLTSDGVLNPDGQLMVDENTDICAYVTVGQEVPTSGYLIGVMVGEDSGFGATPLPSRIGAPAL